MLAEYLPEDAALWRPDGWTTDRRLMGMLIELVDALRIQTAALTGDKKVKQWKPVEVLPRDKPKPKDSYLKIGKGLMGKG